MRNMQSSLRHVMSAIENLRDDLKTLSDTIWTSIDHNDPGSLEQGFRFKQAFNERWSVLDEAAAALWQLLKAERAEEVEAVLDKPIPDVKPKGRGGKDTVPKGKTLETGGGEPEAVQEPEAAEPALEEATEVAEDFKGKTPFGFMLGGRTFTSPSNWGLFYQALLQELAKQYPEAFDRLPERKAWRDRRGKPLFTRTQDVLRRPLEITEQLYAEADLPLTLIVQGMRQLARELKLPPDALKILLKEDRRGTVETKPLAA